MDNISETTIYDIPLFSYLGFKIQDDSLTLISEIQAGDAGDIVNHYILSKEETTKLFDLMSLDEFIKFCQKERSVHSILNYLESKGIKNRIKPY